MANVTDLCQRLESWLANRLPGALATLKQGATDKEIVAHERQTGFELPEDVRAWFHWRDGQQRYPDESILFGYELLSLQDSAEEWQSWQEVAEMNEEIAEHCTSRPADAIIAAYTLPGWIPLAQSPAASAYLGIDLNPGPTGRKGQVLNFGRDDEEKSVAGASFADFLEFVVEEMESGRVTVGNSGDPVHSFFYRDLYGNAIHFATIVARLHDLGKFDGRRLHVDDSIARIVPLPPERGERLRRLHDAALNNELEEVRQILEADPGLVEYRDPWGSTLLHIAAEAHSPSILDYLSRFGLNPKTTNNRGETPIMCCERANADDADFQAPSAEQVARFEQTLERLRKMS